MLYNSLHFLVFFVIVTSWYFLLPSKLRWVLLLLASCYFYMAFVPLYLAILGFTIVVDYFAGIWIAQHTGKARKAFLIASLVANIGILVVFKYFNFLSENLNLLIQWGGHEPVLPYLEILLPIGLSFHTFQAMSYTIEVYRGNQTPEKNFGIYALYVMFYPQLVAGPIERPQNILHQFYEKHSFSYTNLKSGLMQMAWGLMKKVVIADRVALAIDPAFNNPSTQSGSTLLVAALLYSFQIYCDFSGYSDIGIGAARVMGYDLMKNFDSPYLSTTFSEFWRRWHISLSTWFRDYLYIPLGGNRVSKLRANLNLFFVFLVSGVWHGASWTFVIWGALHGLFLMVENVFRKKNSVKVEDAKWKIIFKTCFIFLFVSVAWVFFRSKNLTDALTIFHQIGSASVFDQVILNINGWEFLFLILFISIVMFKEKYFPNFYTVRTSHFAFWMGILLTISYFLGVFGQKQFIYFQF